MARELTQLDPSLYTGRGVACGRERRLKSLIELEDPVHFVPTFPRRTQRACDPEPAQPSSGQGRAVFLDRDGTLILNQPYNADPSKIELLPGVPEALRILRDSGYQLVVVTNQSGVARGHFGEEALTAMHQHINDLLAPFGVGIDVYYYCPHHVDGVTADYARPCTCRKPNPGMLWRAASDLSLSLERCWIVGDQPTDAMAGLAAHCRAILIGSDQRLPDRASRAIDILQAARRIVQLG